MVPLEYRLLPFVSPDPAANNLGPALDIEITGTVLLDDDMLNVNYHLTGALDRVKFASPGTQPARKNELWRTTCFELFLKLPGRKNYWEYNLSPSRDWNVYHFKRYRGELQPELEIADISIAAEVAQRQLINLRAALPLSPLLADRRLAIGISSVIEDTAGNIHYYALQHGGAKPDFHDPASFVLSLDPI